VFVTAAFAFAGTELVGLAAAETANPRKSLPTAVKQVFWRITLFYIVSLTLIGLLVPYDDGRLLNGKSSADATASPFVIAIQNAGISGLPSVMNVVIMIAVLSVGNSSIYGSSRTLAALAEQGQAPRILAYIDRKGRPMVGIALSSALGFLAFLAGSDQQTNAFNWMLAISGLSSIFTWASICLAHIRFRKGWKVQGHSLDELAFRSQPGVIGSWIGFIMNCLVLMYVSPPSISRFQTINFEIVRSSGLDSLRLATKTWIAAPSPPTSSRHTSRRPLSSSSTCRTNSGTRRLSCVVTIWTCTPVSAS
jgi:yeast amino acid transporter